VPELEPGAMTRKMVEFAALADARLAAALTAIGEAVQKQAVINASTGAHPYGTPTPARPGTGPARISGTLVRSIARSDVKRTATGWEVRVGLLHGLYPTYRTSRGAFTSKTPSHEYGEYLERGLLPNGAAYPWLMPAFHHGVHTVTAIVMLELFR
jgi:hypothetical protein